jgi:hypothetical protein
VGYQRTLAYVGTDRYQFAMESRRDLRATGREPQPRERASRTLAALLFGNGWGAARRQRGG